MSAGKKSILERLSQGVLIGDGGFLHGLEKRGYVRAGPWTPECVVQHPNAVKQYHLEFLRAGSDVMQAFTFLASESKFADVEERSQLKIKQKAAEINKVACCIAREVADQGNALVSGSISQTVSYKQGEGKACVQRQFQQQVDCFMQTDIDFIICEFFTNIEELEWAIEVAKGSGLPVAASMCIDCISDMDDVPTGQCAVRMAKAGAAIVGVNCSFDLAHSLKSMKKMKEALERAGLKAYLMVQPYGYHTPDLQHKQSVFSLPEAPYALEARIATRFEVAKWARECYEAGIHYIGGCCGFEPYHIRAISEELWKERGKKCKATEENGFLLEGLLGSPSTYYQERLKESYWKTLHPATGRPTSAAFSATHTDKNGGVETDKSPIP